MDGVFAGVELAVSADERAAVRWTMLDVRSDDEVARALDASTPDTIIHLAGIAFAHAMRAFRWVRSHYDALRYASGTVLVALGLLLFFHRDWWLRVALDQAFTKIGLGSV